VQTIKKHAVLICIIISIIVMVIATWVYPGGSFINSNSTAFDWSKNTFSNLFKEKAINGSDNPARYWGIISVAFQSIGYGLFFIRMSTKIPNKHTTTVLKIIGFANILFNFLIATSLHDMMVVISSSLSMLGLFYITVFVLKTKLHILKTFCIICMLVFYFTFYTYGAGDWGLLAIMQKVSLIGSMFLVLGLDYFTKETDFI